MKSKNIIIFGASKFGELLLNSNLINRTEVKYFFDNDSNKFGTTLLGIPIIEATKLSGDYYIIIASMYHIEIALQILQLGYRDFGVVTQVDTGFEISEVQFKKEVNFEIIPNKIALIVSNYSGSNTYCFKYMLDKYLNTSNINFVLINSKHIDDNFYYDLYTSSIIIGTHEVSCYKDRKNVKLWHGFPLKGMNFMKVDLNNTNTSTHEKVHLQFSKVDKVTSYGVVYNTLMGACFGLSRNKFEITGMPRNDVLLLSDGKKKLENKFEFTKGKKIILYMPTFRETAYGEKNGSTSGYFFEFNDFNIKDIDNFCNQNNIVILIKIHPFDYKLLDNVILNSKSIKLISDEDFNGSDFYEFVNATDILMTDYSSIYFDFLLLDRPIIFTNVDATDYEQNRGFLLEPIDFWRPGETINSTKEFMCVVKNILSGKDNYSEKRNQICDIVHKHKDANSSKRLLEMLLKMI